MDRPGQTILICWILTVFAGWTLSSSVAANPLRPSSQNPATAATTAKPTTLQWQRDLRAAHQASVKSRKPMILVFGASWCGYCKKLDQETLRHPGMVQYINDRFVPIHLDFDKEKRAVEILGVTNLPCTIILSPNADLLERHVGFAGAGEYYQVLRKAEQKNLTLQTAPSPVQPAVGKAAAGQ